MSDIPCRKCPKCGFYHDVSMITCSECQSDLIDVPALLVDIDNIPAEFFGDIDENIHFFVQKCSACGTMNFTSDKDKPVKICYNCHKARISSISPIEYEFEMREQDAADNPSTILTENGGEDVRQGEIAEGQVKYLPDYDEEDDDDDKFETEQFQKMFRNLKRVIDTNPVIEMANINEPDSGKMKDLTEENVKEDDEYADWSNLIDSTKTDKKSITLTAIRYGHHSFTLEAKANVPYMLGRYANQREFLSNDLRVGNEHCLIIFKNGCWYVKDNNSANGTAVNSKDIGIGGEHELNDGDELKLGHHSDSMAFRITI